MAKIYCKSSYLLRRDTAANWSAKNPILREGEEGYETDTGKRKVGDGTTEWNNLKYDSGIVDQIYTPDSENAQSGKAVSEAVSDKQDSLVSGTNIKTINNQSILGSGNITIEGGSDVEVDQNYNPTSENAQSGKAVAQAVAIEQNRADNTFANALKGNKSDTAMLLDDVSPVTHDMGVKVRKVNLFDVSKIQSKNGITNNGDGTLTLAGGQYALNTRVKLSDVCPDLKVGDTVFLSATTTGTGLWSFDSSPIWTFNTSFEVTENAFKGDLYLYGKNSNASDFNEPHTISNIQIEYGEKATNYRPYVPDLTTVKVSRCGKNLIQTNIIEVTSPGGVENLIWQGNISGKLSFSLDNSEYTPNPSNASAANFKFVLGDGTDKYLAAYDNSIHLETPSPLKEIYFLNWGQGTGVIKNIQLEIGSSETDYEPYVEPTYYTPNADGTVNGVTSLYPNTTLMTDTEGVIIDCEYNRDINKAFAALEAAIATNNS